MKRRLLNLLIPLSLLLCPGSIVPLSGCARKASCPPTSRITNFAEPAPRAHEVPAQEPPPQAPRRRSSREFPLLPGRFPRGFAHGQREITLTPDARRDDQLGVELLDVQGDGTTFIRVDKTGETLAALPDAAFLGKRSGPHNVRIFGEHGLTLLRSDPEKQTAVLTHRWAEPR